MSLERVMQLAAKMPHDQKRVEGNNRYRPSNLEKWLRQRIDQISQLDQQELLRRLRSVYVSQDFGQVTEAETQSGVPRGRVRVVDESGAEHTKGYRSLGNAGDSH